MNMFRNMISNWMYVDTRTLAFFRIVFGFMGLVDVLRRYQFIDVFYSNMGMDFRRHVVSKYSIKYFSLLDHASDQKHPLFKLITNFCHWNNSSLNCGNNRRLKMSIKNNFQLKFMKSLTFKFARYIFVLNLKRFSFDLSRSNRRL